ncbi:MAG: S-layer homology domain-containing protein, partial [Oscillospiraceae bacterium]
EIMGKGDEARAQMNRTIFTDVKGTHWGRGYVNLAATMVLDESTGTRLMMGTGSGRFEPERDISYREAVTLILRMLGYGAEAERNWPAGAVQTAAELGLDEGLNVSDPAAALTRGQAALLFCRLLATPAKGEEEPYAHKLGTLVEDAIILSVDATLNGQSGWVVATKGGPYRARGSVDSGLVGRRGDLLLDRDGRFITLLIDESQCVTVTVSRTQGNYLHAANGVRYTLADDTPVYSGASGEVSTYQETLPSIKPGDVVTLYLDAGQVVGMFRSSASVESGFLVAQGTVSAASLYPLTGGASDYTVRKNGSTISLQEIKKYDVLTYDAVSKVLYVSDTRISCVYENAAPSLSAPSAITVLGGNTFDVMADAMDTLAQFRIGQSFTLLLTADGRVAGAVQSGTTGNAMGLVSGDKLTLTGINKTLDLSKAGDTARLDGQLVYVSGSHGQINLRKVPLSTSTGSFEKASMRLGSLSVSGSVRIYEQGADGLTAVSLSSLPATVPASGISGYRTDSSGKVDLIVLRDSSGDGYTYGRIEFVSKSEMEYKPGGDPLREGGGNYTYNSSTQTLTITDGSIVVTGVVFENGYAYQNGYRLDVNGKRIDWEGYLVDGYGNRIREQQDVLYLRFTTPDGSREYRSTSAHGSAGFGVITTYTDWDGVEFASVKSTLTAVTNVRSADFYTVDGVTYVQAKGQTYEVADNVLCYNASASGSRWIWGANEGSYVYTTENLWFDSLLEARTFSDTLTIYVDSVGQKVRAVSA